MINVNNIDKLKTLFANIFFYGISHSYSYDYIEKNLCNASFIHALEEQNDDSFLYRNTSYAIQEIYPEVTIEEINQTIVENNSLCLWLGEAYVRLFFAFNKSLSYIFLYFPLSLGIHSFDVYHEMDFHQLYSFFEELSEQETIVSKLLKKREMNKEQLSVLSGIKKNTLLNYTRSNENIYKASYDHLFLLGKILKTNTNIFARRIYSVPTSSMYRYNKEDKVYRLKLGLLFAKYYSREIRDIDYSYDTQKKMYIGKDSYFDVTWTDYKEGLGLTTTSENKNIQDKVNQYLNEHPGIDRTKLNLVVFEFDGMSESIDYYLQLNHLGLKNIIIINPLYFFQINSKIHRTQNISDEVNEFLMQRASV